MLLMRWTLRAACVSLCAFAVTLAGCATGHGIGKGATSGALEELETQSKERQEQGRPAPAAEIMHNAVKGTLDELDGPERQAQVRRLVGLATESVLASAAGARAMAGPWGGGPVSGAGAPNPDGSVLGAFGDKFSAGFAQGLSRQLRLELGTNGDGPLGKSLSGWMQDASGAAASGVVSALGPTDPECTAGGRACVDKRVYDLSRIAGSGFTDGVTERLRLPLALLSFGAGLAIAFFIAALMRRRRHG